MVCANTGSGQIQITRLAIRPLRRGAARTLTLTVRAHVLSLKTHRVACVSLRSGSLSVEDGCPPVWRRFGDRLAVLWDRLSIARAVEVRAPATVHS